MKQYWALYCKEMKRIRSVVIFLVLIYSVFFLLYNSDIIQNPLNNYYSLFYYLIIVGIIWTSPFIFAYSLYEEWNNQTIYQIYSLPVKRFTAICYKYLAAFTIGIITILGTTVCQYIFSTINSPNDTPLPVEFAIKVLILNLYVLGITCAICGIIFSISRYRFLVIVMAVPALILLTIKVDTFAKRFIASMGMYNTLNLHHYPNLLWIIIGFIYLFIGLVLFEKYAEA